MHLLFVKVSEPNIAHRSVIHLFAAHLLQYHYIRHGIVFHVQCNGTVIICRKQMTRRCFDTLKYRHVTFTNSTGIKVSRYKSARLCIYSRWKTQFTSTLYYFMTPDLYLSLNCLFSESDR